MLVEACEYRANFLHLRPRHALILGIESDHFDCYGSLQQIEAAFQQFAASVPADGLVLARHDCPSTRRVIAGLTCRVETFGFDPDADWSADSLAEESGLFRFGVCHEGRKVCDVRLSVPGRHNVLNALAAAALACENGLSGQQVAAGLAGFPGLQRRLEMRGLWRGATLIDDYAHHPTEVAAALAAVRGLFPRRRVWCVFQPHQVSRTERLLDELAESLQNADKVLVSEIFRAREGGPRPGEVTAVDLARQARAGGVEVLPARTDEEICRTLENRLAPGDVLVVMGAGDTAGLWPEGSRRLARPLVAGGTL
jgi:UDP-N-acetylmuramate--alanine ligase